PYRKAPMTTHTPLARYSATNGALVSGFAAAELHHLMGHDRQPPLLKLRGCFEPNLRQSWQ
ncbi:hypothetical protein NKI35_30650, partial [Mesorhizobium sp. M0676]